MVYEDPLQFISIPGLSSLVQPVASYFGYTVLPAHISEVVFAAALYQFIFTLSGYLSPIFVPSYKTLNKKTQLNFDIHVVSHVQAILIILLSLPLFGDKVLAADRIYGYTPYSGFVSAMALGYFVWDIIICTKYINMFGIGFLVHGLSAFFVFLQSFRPFLIHYGPHFLLFELSTPFLNVNWFASHLPEGVISFKVQKINGLCLLISFFTIRIVWGFYQAFRVANDVFFVAWSTRTFPAWVGAGVSISNIALDVLNVYWFYKMVRLAIKAVKTGSGRAISPKKKQ